MKLKQFSKILTISLFALMAYDPSYAGSSISSSGGGRSFSGGSSYSRPSAPSPTPSTGSTYSKPSTVAPTASPAKPSTALGVAEQKSNASSSYKSYKASTEPKAAPTSYVKSNYGSYNDFNTHRASTVVVYQSRYPHAYTYGGYMPHPYYGGFDSSFLMGMLIGEMGSHASNTNWLYSHQNDSWYPQWRADAEKQAENNAELKTKLADMDRQLNELKKNNTPIQAVPLPVGIDPSVALNPDDVKEQLEEDETHYLLYSSIFGSLLLVGGLGFLYVKGKK